MNTQDTAQHYFASNAFGWGTGETRQAAIERCIQAATRGTVRKITLAQQKKGEPGFYLWSCKVHGPSDAHYRIEWYMPKGIEISEARHHDVTYCTAKELAYTTRENDIS